MPPRFALLALGLLVAGLPVAARAGDFTLEFHVRGTLADNAAPAVECGANANWVLGNIVLDRDPREPGGGDRGVSLGAGRVVFGLTNVTRASATFCGATDVLDGAWHHVAVQRRAADGFVQIWVDGALDAAGAGAPGDVADPAGGAGADAPGPASAPFSGRVDGPLVSPGLRYAAPFAPPAPPSPGPAFPAAGEGQIEACANPALGQTLLWVRYGDDRAGEVAVDILDAGGRRAATLRGTLRAGAAMLVWDGRADDGAPLRPGVYFARADGAREPARIERP